LLLELNFVEALVDLVDLVDLLDLLDLLLDDKWGGLT